MTCIKTGARVKLLNYGCVVAADLYRVGNAIVIRGNADMPQNGNYEPGAFHDFTAVIPPANFYMNNTIGVVVVQDDQIAYVVNEERLQQAKAAMDEYSAAFVAGGEIEFPHWASSYIKEVESFTSKGK